MKQGDIIQIIEPGFTLHKYIGEVCKVGFNMVFVKLDEPWPCSACDGGRKTPYQGCTDCYNTGVCGEPEYEATCKLENCKVIGHVVCK